MLTLDISGDLALTDGNFRVVGNTGSYYKLRNLATGEYSNRHLTDLLDGLSPEQIPSWGLAVPQELTELSASERKDVEAWAAHIEEMCTGHRPGHEKPRPKYDPALTTLNSRADAKVNELRALGMPASRASLLRKKALYERGGSAALIDRRKVRMVEKLGRVDPAVRDAIAHVIAKNVNKSTVTQAQLHTQVHAEVVKQFGTDAGPRFPSRASLYRHFKEMTKAKHTTGKATTRRSAANTPNRTYGATQRFLPGEEVQVDSTTMDILVKVKNSPKPQRPVLTIMVDRATRSIIASTIRLEAAKGYDHALLLAQALVPFPSRPDRSSHRKLVGALNPDFRLLSETERRQAELARPFIFPRRIVTDNGRDYLSTVFTSACQKFGIDITMSAIHTPTDKPIVERTFQSINTLFTQGLPGYVGDHTVNRGHNIEKEDLLDLSTLIELFDDWVANVWQKRRHEGLMDPFEPSITYSPNQFYNAASIYAGTVAIPLRKDDFIELLPSSFRTITSTGVQVNNRHYDSDELHPFRNSSSNRPKHQTPDGQNKWEVKTNPYDAAHVWVRSPKNTWIECHWRQLAGIDHPLFGEISRNLRSGDRNEVAQEHAHFAGTAMPEGASIPEPDEDFDLDSLSDDFTTYEPFDFEE